MAYHQELPFTGLGALTVGGIVFQEWWLVLAAIAAMVVGALIIRFVVPAKK